jgi:Zn-dependent peptidase ImmA (M78 family)
MRLAQMPTNQLAALHRGATTHKAYEDTEWQANGFAGALFMPAKGLAELQKTYGLLTTDMIQETFKVSYEAAGIRREVFSQRKELLLV